MPAARHQDPTPTPRYRRRVLLAVSGLSPQVVTETLYALAQRDRATMPNEVHLMTTSEGAERAQLLLLSRKPGWFRQLCREHGLSGVAFTPDHIHVAQDRRGRPLTDIRTPAENEALADQITELVRGFTSEASLQLHLSLAGGRKTMGFYAGYALSLYGREQDRLSHVLVSPPPFESHPDFFYPARRPRTIQTPGRKPLDAARAEVTLAEIPFVRMREKLSSQLVKGKAGFSATVAAYNRANGPLRLRLDPLRRHVDAGGVSLRLPPREMAFYLWMARRRQLGQPGLACPKVADRDFATAFLAEFEQWNSRESSTRERLDAGLGPDFFSEVKSKLNAALTRAGAASAYHVQRQMHRDAPASFALLLPPDRIQIESEALA